MVNQPVFGEDFFKKIADVIFTLSYFFRRYWFIGIVLLLTLFFLIFFQQIILFLFSAI